MCFFLRFGLPAESSSPSTGVLLLPYYIFSECQTQHGLNPNHGMLHITHLFTLILFAHQYDVIHKV